MFCAKCGNKLKDGSLFCSHCGAKIENTSLRNQEKERKETAVPELGPGDSVKYSNNTAKQIIGKQTDYYLKQFETIQQTGTCKMNWASFFFGLLHSAYRNVWKNWLKAVRFPLITELAGIFLIGIIISFLPELTIVILAVIMGGSVWMIIAQILYAKRFNRTYMNHVQQKLAKGDQKSDVSIKRMILTYLAFMACVVLVSGIITAVTLWSLSLGMENSSDYDYDYELDSDFDHYMSEDILENFEESENFEETKKTFYDEKKDKRSETGSNVDWVGTYIAEDGQSITISLSDESSVVLTFAGYSEEGEYTRTGELLYTNAEKTQVSDPYYYNGRLVEEIVYTLTDLGIQVETLPSGGWADGLYLRQ